MESIMPAALLPVGFQRKGCAVCGVDLWFVRRGQAAMLHAGVRDADAPLLPQRHRAAGHRPSSLYPAFPRAHSPSLFLAPTAPAFPISRPPRLVSLHQCIFLSHTYLPSEAQAADSLALSPVACRCFESRSSRGESAECA
eukprot:2603472-Rhodomonas_salina.3